MRKVTHLCRCVMGKHERVIHASQLQCYNISSHVSLLTDSVTNAERRIYSQSNTQASGMAFTPTREQARSYSASTASTLSCA